MSSKKGREVSLIELCDSITDCSHSTPVWTSSGKIVIRNANIKNGRLDLSTPSYTDVEHFNKRIKRQKPEPGDLIITREAPMGEVCIIPDGIECCLGQRMVLLKPKKNICSNKYLLYAILSNYVQNQISWSKGTGTTVSNLRIPHLEQLKIPYVDINSQKLIAATLSCLDEKIELNSRMNKKLDEMAQAIFKYWLVDFEFTDENGNPYKSSGGKMIDSELGEIPKGWRVIKVGDIDVKISDYVANGSFASLKQNVTLYEEINYAYFIRNVDLKARVFKKFVDEHSYNFLSKTKLFGNEVIISNVGDVGSVFLCPILDKPMTLGNNIIMIKSENKVYYNYFMYLLFKDSYGKDLIKSITGGSAQPKFNKTDFRSLKIILPTDDVIVQFNDLVEKLFELRNKNSSEITTLTIIRDTLLPKLLSGEIELPIKEEV